MSKKILYASIDGAVYEDLTAIAGLAGISIAKTAEAIIATASGRDNTFSQQVERARRTWKAAQK